MSFLGKPVPSRGPLGGDGDGNGKEGEMKSVANLHYVNVASKKTKLFEEIDKEEVVMEEWDDFLA